MLNRSLSIQSAEDFSGGVARIILVSKNSDGEAFIETHGREFFGVEYSTSENFREILLTFSVEENSDNFHVNKNLGFFFNRQDSKITFVYKKFSQLNLDIDISEKIRLMSEIAQCIEYLHSNRIVHGNISNKSFVKIGSKTKLIGLEKSLFLPECEETTLSRRQYRKTFRSLEAFNSVCGFHTDVWALGCVFSIIIYGSNLFPYQDSNDEYISCLESWKENKKNSSGKSVEVPELYCEHSLYELNILIFKMLNSDKNKRISIFEVAKILAKMNDSSISSSPTDMPSFFLDSFEKSYKILNYKETRIVGYPRDAILTKLSEKPSWFQKIVMSVYENVQRLSNFSALSLEISIGIANYICFGEGELTSGSIRRVINDLTNGVTLFSFDSVLI